MAQATLPKKKAKSKTVVDANGAAAEKPGPTSAPPVMKVTRYDQVSTFMMALVFGLVIAAFWLGVIYFTNRVVDSGDAVPVEIFEIGGEQGDSLDETLKVESPEDVTDDPSLADIEDEVQVEDTIENVIELAETASQQVEQQYEVATDSAGKPGSATGTGQRAFGSGPGTGNAHPPGARWFIRWSDQGSIDSYARQLDQFGIQLGVMLPGGEIVICTNLATAKPTVNRHKGKNPRKGWMYFTWAGGGRKVSDQKLLKKAGVDVGQGVILHFYPKQTEIKLLTLEKQYQNRDVKDIRRTYFVVRRAGSQYEFIVARQSSK